MASLALGGALALSPLPLLGVAAGGLGFVLGAALWPFGALAAIVATLPFYLFQRQMAGQAISPTEAAILLGTFGIAARALWDRLGLGTHLSLTGGHGDARVVQSTAAAPTRRHLLGRPDDGWECFDGPIVLFLAAALLSLLATEHLRLSLRELRTLIVEPLLVFFLLRAVVHTPAAASRLIDVLAAVTTVVAVFAIMQYFVGGAVTDVQGVRRVQGTYASPNHLALLLGRSIPFLLAAAWLLPRHRPIRLSAAALCGAALLLTFSVGGWLGTGVALAVVAGLLGGRRWVASLVAVAVLAAILAATIVPVERLASRFDPASGTALVRVQLWRAAVELIREHPLLGVGLDNFLYRYSVLIPPSTGMEPNLSHPHNLILQFWLQLGAPGVFALGWLLVAGGRIVRHRLGHTTEPMRRALAVGIAGSLANFVVHGSIDNSYFLVDMACIFWLTAAVAATVAGPTESEVAERA